MRQESYIHHKQLSKQTSVAPKHPGNTTYRQSKSETQNRNKKQPVHTKTLYTNQKNYKTQHLSNSNHKRHTKHRNHQTSTQEQNHLRVKPRTAQIKHKNLAGINNLTHHQTRKHHRKHPQTRSKQSRPKQHITNLNREIKHPQALSSSIQPNKNKHPKSTSTNKHNHAPKHPPPRTNKNYTRKSSNKRTSPKSKYQLQNKQHLTNTYSMQMHKRNIENPPHPSTSQVPSHKTHKPTTYSSQQTQKSINKRLDLINTNNRSQS